MHSINISSYMMAHIFIFEIYDAKIMWNRSIINKRIALLDRTSKILKALAEEPMPKNLSLAQQKEFEAYSKWLKNTSKQLDSLVRKTSKGSFRTMKAMQEIDQSFNLQYLQLQNKISHENRQFTMISNIMKNKHDTAKNAINNLR